MNPTREFARSVLPSLPPARSVRASGAAAPQLTLSRAGLPVVSNRAFISAWMARRERLAAASQLMRQG
jgi:hypothetical protein